MSVAQDPHPQISYSTKTDFQRNVVEIQVPGSKSFEIGLASLPSVTNVLSAFWSNPDTRLLNNSVLIIKDEFSGSSTSVTVEALRDVSKVLTSLSKGSASNVSTRSSAADTDEAPKKRGRPRKNAEASSSQAETTSTEPVKRGPGRPKKTEVTAAPTPVSSIGGVAQKKRGRPKKTEAVASTAESTSEVTAEAPKKRGRPKKVDAVVKRGRGRPKKSETTAAAPAEAVATPVAEAPKRGRPKKSEVPATAEIPTKRGPGRPKKSEVQAQEAPAVAATPAKRGRGRPKKSETATPVAVTAEAPKKRGRPKKVDTQQAEVSVAAETPKATKPLAKKEPSRRTKKADAVATATPQLEKRGRGRPSRAETEAKKAMEAAKDVPAWFQDGQNVYPGSTPDGRKFLLIKTPLTLEASGSRNVTGAATPGQNADAFGYEVTSDGQHVAWVIAEAEDALYLCVPGEEPTRQRNIGNLISKIMSSVLPNLDNVKQAA